MPDYKGSLPPAYHRHLKNAARLSCAAPCRAVFEGEYEGEFCDDSGNRLQTVSKAASDRKSDNCHFGRPEPLRSTAGGEFRNRNGGFRGDSRQGREAGPRIRGYLRDSKMLRRRVLLVLTEAKWPHRSSLVFLGIPPCHSFVAHENHLAFWFLSISRVAGAGLRWGVHARHALRRPRARHRAPTRQRAV